MTNYRKIYCHDGRTAILKQPDTASPSEFNWLAFRHFYPEGTHESWRDLQSSTGLNWPVMTGLAYRTRRECSIESPAKPDKWS